MRGNNYIYLVTGGVQGPTAHVARNMDNSMARQGGKGRLVRLGMARQRSCTSPKRFDNNSIVGTWPSSELCRRR
jgi:hypothetical protein